MLIDQVSPVEQGKQATHFELWVLGSKGFALLLNDCGLFESREGANFAGSAVRTWLHQGVWCSVLDYLPPEGSDELAVLRRGLVALEIDPASVHVDVRPYSVGVNSFGDVLSGGDDYGDSGDDLLDTHIVDVEPLQSADDDSPITVVTDDDLVAVEAAINRRRIENARRRACGG